MIVNVSDNGVLELYWRHPVSRRVDQIKTMDFLFRHRRSSAFVDAARRLSAAGSETGERMLGQIAQAIRHGEITVLQHRSELRWAGIRSPLMEISSSALLLLRDRTQPSRDLDQGRRWLYEAVSDRDVRSAWKVLWLPYTRSVAPIPPSVAEFQTEVELLLKTGELVAIYHVIPAIVGSEASGWAAAGAASARAQPLAPPPDPSTFDPDHHTAAQVQALQNGAESGAPFCEICNQK